MAGPWSYTRWMKETTVGGTIYGEKTRSPLLIAVDNALKQYDFAHTDANKLKAVHNLRDAFDAWCASKTDPNASIRDKGGNVADFKAWIDEQENGMMPVVEAGWTGNQNCYAYAMKCRLFNGAVPTPGAFARKAVLTSDRRWQQQQQRIRYYAELLHGVVEDAKADGNKVVEILRGPEEGQLASALNPPTDRCDGAHYLAAMVIKSTGFHFMRRDSRTGLWTHKNGGLGNAVETSATVIPTGGRTSVHHVPISDTVVVELLQGKTDKYMGFPDFKFGGYLLVPDAGVQVSGEI